jgi:hypothetical protein
VVFPHYDGPAGRKQTRIWRGIFDADKGVAQYPFSEPNLQFGSVRPLQIMENNQRAFGLGFFQTRAQNDL